MGFLSIISYNCMQTRNYLKIKSWIKEKDNEFEILLFCNYFELQTTCSYLGQLANARQSLFWTLCPKMEV